MANEVSPLERARAGYAPRVPPLLRRGAAGLAVADSPAAEATRDAEAVRGRFPRSFGRPGLRFVAGAGPAGSRPFAAGVVLSGGQAPGGHNVIAGLLDGLRDAHPGSRLFGFLGGPRGIFTDSVAELTPDRVEPYRNTGGFDMIGSGRDKIETDEQIAACAAACGRLALDGLVVVGGDDSNTNAAILAEAFLARGVPTSVVGVPKTIDGDLRGGGVEISFGFDTATRVYSESIGNICRDAKSAGKYWHFIKLMGRSASHVTLECALRTRANVALIAEEVAERGLTLAQVAEEVARAIRRRAESGRHYGVCLVPEGLIEFVPEMRALIDELNGLLHDTGHDAGSSAGAAGDAEARVVAGLGAESAAAFRALPDEIRRQLLLDRDSHGNVQVSKIETEKLVESLVSRRVAEWRAAGEFPGKFAVQHHFLGYEGRCAAPSNFDADYTYTLGRTAALLCAFGKTGYLCSVANLSASPGAWEPAGVPLTSLMQIETRKGRSTPVIAKALVETGGAAFAAFARERERWQIEDAYLYPGPIQYFGPADVTDGGPLTLALAGERQ